MKKVILFGVAALILAACYQLAPSNGDRGSFLGAGGKVVPTEGVGVDEKYLRKD